MNPIIISWNMEPIEFPIIIGQWFINNPSMNQNMKPKVNTEKVNRLTSEVFLVFMTLITCGKAAAAQQNVAMYPTINMADSLAFMSKEIIFVPLL